MLIWKCPGKAKVGKRRMPREQMPRGHFQKDSQGGVKARENARGKARRWDESRPKGGMLKEAKVSIGVLCR